MIAPARKTVPVPKKEYSIWEAFFIMTKQSLKLQSLHFFAALLLGLLILFFLKPGEHLTAVGVRVIAVMIPMLYLWLTANTHWTCLLALALLVTTGAMSANEVWAGSLGSFVVMTVLAYMILNVCLKETGVIDRIAIWFITRPFVRGRPYLFMAMFFASNLLIGMFMENLTLAIIYIGITEGIARHLKLEKGDPMYTVLFTGVMWGNVLVACCSPVAHVLPNVLMALLETQAGIRVSYASWFAYGTIFSAVMFGIMMLIIRIWKPDTSAFQNYDPDEIRASAAPLGKAGVIAAAVFLAVILFALLPSSLSFLPVFSVINSWGAAVPALFAICLLALIHIDGRAVLDVPAAMKQIPLPSVIFAGTVSVFAVPLSSEATGITPWLGEILVPVLGGHSVWFVLVILIALAILMTNFLSNMVTQILFFNIGFILLRNSFSMGAFCILIGVASGIAVATPSANIPSPLFFGPGHITMRGTWKANLAFVLAGFLLSVVPGIALAAALTA